MFLHDKGTNNVPTNQELNANLVKQFSHLEQLIHQAANSGTPATPTAVKIDLTGEPSHLPKALFLGEIPLLSKGELCTIVALPSSGKSNVCEGIVASYTRAKGFEPLDALSFVCPSEHATKKILWIDTERTNNDLLYSVKRLKSRCKLDANQLAEHLDFFSFVEIASPAEALKELTNLVSSGNYDAVILDGIFDFCPDINHIEKATLVVKELRALAVKYDVAIITTIHPNKGTDTIAGHLGAMLYRFSRAILYIEKQANGVRRLTSEIGQGKLSYSSEPANSFFKWCDADNMFISCEPQTAIPTSYNIAIIHEIFTNETKLPSKEFKAKYSEKTGYKAATTNAHCLAMQKDGIIESIGNTTNTIYRLLSDETIPF
jgi:hypothetical protein